MSRISATDFPVTMPPIVVGKPNGPTIETMSPAAVAAGFAAAAAKKPDKAGSGADALKRLKSIEQLGQQIQSRKRDRDQQETKVSAAKSKLDDERETFNQLSREVDEMQEDLDKLALGGFAERLPFGGKSGRQKAGETAPAGDATTTAPKGRVVDQDLQRRFDEATLPELGVTGAMLDKLESDGIRNGSDLQKWFAQHPRRKIHGVGESAVERLNDLMAEFFEKAQAELTASKAAGGAPERAFARGDGDAEAFDTKPKESDVVPLAKAMGAKTQPRTKSGKPKRFAGNPKLNKRAKAKGK